MCYFIKLILLKIFGLECLAKLGNNVCVENYLLKIYEYGKF